MVLVSTWGEEVSEQGRAFVGSHVVDDLELVVETRISSQIVERATGPGFQVGGAENDSGDTGLLERPGTHRARLERDDNGGPIESPRPDGLGSVAHGEEFGVGGGITGELAFVVTTSHDLAVDDHHRADGNVAVFGRGAGFVEGEGHHGGPVRGGV